MEHMNHVIFFVQGSAHDIRIICRLYQGSSFVCMGKHVYRYMCIYVYVCIYIYIIYIQIKFVFQVGDISGLHLRKDE